MSRLRCATRIFQIVAAAWAQWGTNAFAKLIGDWALAIWKPTERTLLLAQGFHRYSIIFIIMCARTM